MARLDPTVSTIKTLFALSCNVCAVPECEQRLADPSWPTVMADIAHICGANPGSARYHESMTDEERRAPENLLLVCPNHHRLIDVLDAEKHPPDTLRRWKEQHERHCAGSAWTDESHLERYAALLLGQHEGIEAALPQLVLRRGSGDSIEVVNTGGADAIDIRVEPVDDNTADELFSMQDAPPSLAPGGRWKAGYYAPSLGSKGTHVARLHWTDSTGRAYSGDFPLS